MITTTATPSTPDSQAAGRRSGAVTTSARRLTAAAGDVALERLTPIAIVLFPLQLFLGLGWVRAGIEKLISVHWWNGSALRAWLDVQAGPAVGDMSTVSAAAFAPLAVPISILVMFTQPIIGICLMTGRYMRPALWWAITLNVVFVLMGAVTPSAFYLVIEVALLTALNLGLVGHAPRDPNRKIAALWTAAAIAAAPFIATLAPEKVIHDPGMMLATIASIGAASEALHLIARHIETSRQRSVEPRQRVAAGRRVRQRDIDDLVIAPAFRSGV